MVFITLFFSFLMCSKASAADVKILTYGDSLTAGLKQNVNGVITCPAGVDAEIGRYPSNDPRVVCYGNGVINKGGYQAVLVDLISGVRVSPEVINFGYSGIETFQMVNTMGQVFSSQPNVDFILIFGGANDAYKGRSSGTVVANLSLIVDEAKRLGIVPVITTVTRNSGNSSADFYADRYSSAIKMYASANNILLADARNIMYSNWNSFNSGDGLHLNASGDNALANVYFNVLGITMPNHFPIPALLLLLLD